jgi:hypothetical protein
MLITRVSPVTGIVASWEMNITPEQWSSWCSGMLIQNAMPHLSPDEREFIMTGMTPNDWDSLFTDTIGVEYD